MRAAGIRQDLQSAVATAVDASEGIVNLLEVASTSGRPEQSRLDQRRSIADSLSITSRSGGRREGLQPQELQQRVISLQNTLLDLPASFSRRQDLRDVIDFLARALNGCLDVLQRLITYNLVKLYLMQWKIHNILFSVETDLRRSFNTAGKLTPAKEQTNFKQSCKQTLTRMNTFTTHLQTLKTEEPSEDNDVAKANDFLEDFPERLKAKTDNCEKLFADYRNAFNKFGDMLTDKELANCLSTIGLEFFSQGKFKSASDCQQHCLRMRRELHEEPHVNTALCLQHLGLALTRQGKSQEAVKYLAESYEMQVELKVDGKALAVCLNSLAYWTWQVGRCEDAQKLYIELLKLETDVYGPDHENVGCTLHNLACLLMSSGRAKSAKYVFQRALNVRTKARVSDKDLAATLHSLGHCLYKLKEYSGAEAMHLEALNTRLRVHGEEHLSVTESLNNLSLVYWEQGKLNEAEKMLNRVASLYAKLSNVSNSDVASCFTNLGLILRDKGQFAIAALNFRKAINAVINTPGEHDRTLVLKQEMDKATAAAEQEVFTGITGSLAADNRTANPANNQPLML